MTERSARGVIFGEDGLVPAVVQDVVSGDVLMVAWMNEDALRLTRETGRAHYWSRGRRKLWRKGETSGHEQIVSEIRVNCERNSLLLQVQQIGAVCHDGYPTCYYRQLEPDNTLTVVRERAFDPDAVYPDRDEKPTSVSALSSDALLEATSRQFGAYVYLRDQPLEEVSATSRRLRGDGDSLHLRLADELIELAGVLEGQHGHTDRASDLRLEASQAIYWLLLLSVRSGTTWRQLRPDRALGTAGEPMAASAVANLLRADADQWANIPPTDNLAARGHATLALIAQACHTGGGDPVAVVEADLAELASRPYLAPYFADRAPFDEGHE